MTLFDWILLIVIIAGVWLGWRRGVLSQAGAVVGCIAAIILCRIFATPLAEHFSSPDDSAQTRLLHTVLSYALIFAACYFGARMISSTLHSILSGLELRGIDKIAGAIYKPLEFVLILSIFINLWVSIMPQSEVHSSQTKVRTMVMNFAPTVLGSETAKDIYAAIDSLDSKAAATFAPDTCATPKQNKQHATRVK